MSSQSDIAITLDSSHHASQCTGHYDQQVIEGQFGSKLNLRHDRSLLERMFFNIRYPHALLLADQGAKIVMRKRPMAHGPLMATPGERFVQERSIQASRGVEQAW